MEMSPKTKILLLALAVCIAVPVIFGEILISSAVGHECNESHGSVEISCHDCLKIELARNLLKTLKMVSAGFALAALLLCFNWNKLKYFITYPYQLSPVLLKVRSNS